MSFFPKGLELLIGETSSQTLKANCKIVDVHVQGWPYSFVVATATIYKDEELLVHLPELFWINFR